MTEVDAHIVAIPEEVWATKAPHGGACTRCGICCMVSLCRLAQNVLAQPELPGPCPALHKAPDGKFACGLIAAPERYAPPGACERHGIAEMSLAAAFLIGAGDGCGMLTSGEKMNRRWLADLDSLAMRGADRAKVGRRMWGVP